MYTSLLPLAAVLLPIPLIIAGIKRREEPYRACMNGIIGAGLAMVMLFILAAQSGFSIAKELALAGEEMAKLLPSDQARIFRELYTNATDGVPGTMLVLAALCAYGEYILLSHVVKVKGQPALRMPPIREFHLPGTVIRGWLVILIISWILKLSGFGAGNVVMVNVNILFEFTFALQGISLFFLWTYMKNLSKAVPVIVVILLWFLPAGMTLLFIAGIVDLFIGLRQRIRPGTGGQS